MLLQIRKACQILGVCHKTLCRWDKNKILPATRTKGNHRRYDLDELLYFREIGHTSFTITERITAAIYARVSTPNQKKDLERQKEYLKDCAEKEGFKTKIYAEIGSGLNDTRPKFLHLLRDALDGEIDRIYVTYLDRLTRFGSTMLLETFKHLRIPVFVACSSPLIDQETVLITDLVALISSFTGKIHSRRRGKNRK